MTPVASCRVPCRGKASLFEQADLGRDGKQKKLSHQAKQAAQTHWNIEIIYFWILLESSNKTNVQPDIEYCRFVFIIHQKDIPAFEMTKVIDERKTLCVPIKRRMAATCYCFQWDEFCFFCCNDNSTPDWDTSQTVGQKSHFLKSCARSEVEKDICAMIHSAENFERLVSNLLCYQLPTTKPSSFQQKQTLSELFWNQFPEEFASHAAQLSESRSCLAPKRQYFFYIF